MNVRGILEKHHVQIVINHNAMLSEPGNGNERRRLAFRIVDDMQTHGTSRGRSVCRCQLNLHIADSGLTIGHAELVSTITFHNLK